MRSLLGRVPLVIELHPGAWPWSGHARADLQALVDEHDVGIVPVSGQSDPLAEHGQVVFAPPERTRDPGATPLAGPFKGSKIVIRPEQEQVILKDSVHIMTGRTSSRARRARLRASR